VGNATSRPHFTPRKYPVPIVQEGGWIPGPAWTGADSICPPTGFNTRAVQSAASVDTVYYFVPMTRTIKNANYMGCGTVLWMVTDVLGTFVLPAAK